MAQWTLDAKQSSINFISTKNVNISEVHEFKNFTGDVQSSGKAKLTIDLMSVATGIEIRNQRMQEMLFEAALYPKAIFTTELKNKFIEELEIGENRPLMLQGIIELRGKSKSVQVATMVVKTSKNTVIVNSIKPLIVDANDFDLQAGVKALQDIAKLDNISTAVPLTFTLVFSR